MPNNAVNVRKTSADVIPDLARQNPPTIKAPTAKSPTVKAPTVKAPTVKTPSMPALPAAGSQWAAQGDRLSSAILSFARFFSLSLKPETTATIRRQVFASMPTQPQPDHAKAATTDAAPEAAAKHREALSLAAAAALGKGVELSPKALEAYAAAIDPTFPDRRGSGGQGRRDGRRDTRTSPAEGQTGEKPAAPPLTSPITAADLREAVLKSAAEDPVLATLNRLPGKNGRRWIVLPFAFGKDGEFHVSMRVLLEGDNPAECRASRMVIDIARYDTTGHWLFAAEWQKGALAGLSVFVQPEQSPKARAQLADELSRLMELPAERVCVRDYPGSFPCESLDTAQIANNLLHSIDEVV